MPAKTELTTLGRAAEFDTHDVVEPDMCDELKFTPKKYILRLTLYSIFQAGLGNFAASPRSLNLHFYKTPNRPIQN